ncbi:hypothetical protein PVAP13_5NG333100 [Panicum virgatum]|uniref:Uncharacterized protein n=1 Tax=Panicum virgatum TaxID=38727 RepID=A0A8T0RWM2_PANVG|nr:hypothetical protein PVAP13_5NG333100 [Panicum virgatum]
MYPKVEVLHMIADGQLQTPPNLRMGLSRIEAIQYRGKLARRDRRWVMRRTINIGGSPDLRSHEDGVALRAQSREDRWSK